jgi:hypothetical protein
MVLGCRVSPAWALVVAMGIGGPAAAEPRAPAPFSAPDARPLHEAAAEAPLRWQSRPRPAAPAPHDDREGPRSVGQPVRPTRGGWNITRVDPQVRPASGQSDPFRDPFGDRAGKSDGPELVLQPTQAEVGIEELPPPRTATRPQPPVAGREGPVLRPVPAPEGGAAAAAQPPALWSISRRLNQRRSEAGLPPCDRIYNDRDCCEALADCEELRQRLRADSIRNISLDITPRYNPDPNVTREEEEAERRDRLALLEVRTWRNRDGRVVATGKMTNLENGAVVLADDAGTEVARVPLRELGDDELCYVNAWWRLPSECTPGGKERVQRAWAPSTFCWHASALCHKPLYFEEVQLERYGHTAGPIRQPFISGAHFFINLAGLPYNMAIHPPTECQYALGYYRPGSCAPWMIPPIPLSLRGAAAEVGAALGFAYLVP